MLIDRIELVAGVCPLVYRQDRPRVVLLTQELTSKKLTGKLAGQWGPGYETRESVNGRLESHREAIERYFEEEVVLGSNVTIPDEDTLKENKLCIARISPPEQAAWVHAYPFPVQADVRVRRGARKKEIGKVAWVDLEAVLAMKGTPNEIIFRPGTYEILEKHRERLIFIQAQKQNGLCFEVGYFPSPVNLPDWRVYDLMERNNGTVALTQNRALSRLGIDSRPLRASLSLIRSLQSQVSG